MTDTESDAAVGSEDNCKSEMIHIAAGWFLMGASDDYGSEHNENEHAQHEVCIAPRDQTTMVWASTGDTEAVEVLKNMIVTVRVRARFL